MPRRKPVTEEEKLAIAKRRAQRRLIRKTREKQAKLLAEKTRPRHAADKMWGKRQEHADPSPAPLEPSNVVTPQVVRSYAAEAERGRPTLLTAEMTRDIADHIRMGAYFNVACRAVGVHVRTASNWRRKGEDCIVLIEKGETKDIQLSDFKFVRFAQAMTQAEGEARLKAEQLVYAGDPRFWLRTGPGREKVDDPGWTDRVEHVGAGGGKIQHTMSIEDLVSHALLPNSTQSDK